MKALITGASSGIGRDIAIELSAKGYEIILVSRNEEKLKEVANQIKTKTTVIVMDLSRIENCKHLYEQVGAIDVLINNAGFGIFGNFAEINLERELDLINTNIIALHILTKLFLIDMKKRNEGYILNVSSIAGFMPGRTINEHVLCV